MKRGSDAAFGIGPELGVHGDFTEWMVWVV